MLICCKSPLPEASSPTTDMRVTAAPFLASPSLMFLPTPPYPMRTVPGLLLPITNPLVTDSVKSCPANATIIS